MGKNRQRKPRRVCCVYGLEPEKLYRNLELQQIKSYGDGVTLEDGTVLHRKKYDDSLFYEKNERTMTRCPVERPLAMLKKCVIGFGIIESGRWEGRAGAREKR